MRSILLTALAGAALSVAELAWGACPPPPCDDASDCAIRADWVVDGTLEGVIPGATYRFCEAGGAPQNAVCGPHTDVPRLVLKDVVVIRGHSPLFKRRQVEIQRAFYCLSGKIGTIPGQSAIDVDARLLGKRLRFSGTNATRAPLIVPGFLVAEILPPPKS